MTEITNEETADDVLVAFAQSGAADVGAWITRYPEHARDLARLGADTWAGGDTTAAADPAREARVREIGLAALRALRAALAAPAPAPAPLTSLKEAARAAGYAPDALARALDLPVALFWKLHRRLLVPASIPKELIAALAERLARAPGEVAAYLSLPPQNALGASYKADTAPREAAARETFADALNTDADATPAHKRRWNSAR